MRTYVDIHTGFRTDTDISLNGRPTRERELQAWSSDAPNGPAPSSPQSAHPSLSANGAKSPGASATSTPPHGPNGALPPSSPHSTPGAAPGPAPNARGDELTFGSTSAAQGWDQFATNQQLFGVTTNYDEEVYTTKLDRSRPDFKEKERAAIALANEINNATTNNPHLAEERGVVDDSGINEEDKYGAVVRGKNAYVPPNARSAAGGAAAASAAGEKAKPAAGAAAAAGTNGASADGAPAKVCILSPHFHLEYTDGFRTYAFSDPSLPRQPQENNLIDNFRDFVTNEKQRLAQKKQQIVKKEKDSRLADLLKFSQEFKVRFHFVVCS